MTEVLQDRRLVAYLVTIIGVLVALAAAGPAWFVTGLCGFVALEAMQVKRPGAAVFATAQPSQRSGR